MTISIPNCIKPFLRFFYYKNERKKVLREMSIRQIQNKEIKQLNYEACDKLIVFIVDGANWFTGHEVISGGILSIASIYEETEKLNAIHQSKVVMVTRPNSHLLLKHTQFPNKIPVFRFKQLTHFKYAKEVLVHIPEYLVCLELIENIRSAFKHIDITRIHINIMNQRIDIMPEVSVIQQIKNRGFKVTQTTAHEQYSCSEVREKYGIPLHKLSVYATPERYRFIKHEDKENLLLLSPDEGELKRETIAQIQLKLPHFQIKEIKDITYMEYLQLIERAKYMITFGEGLDFYFIETVFSGGVAFAVYNSHFFTPQFKNLKGVFSSYQSLCDSITDTICELESSKGDFDSINKQQFNACHTIYNGADYTNNLINFYKQNYLFP